MSLVDRWVVQTALAALGRGAIRLAPGRAMCINISGQTLGDAQFLEFVVECLDRTGVPPAQVCFEVTEAAVVATSTTRAASSACCTAWAASSRSTTSATASARSRT
jgi:EAL domain-containing protein (putative c-di-GMP-specific phosphodiesterase class I)